MSPTDEFGGCQLYRAEALRVLPAIASGTIDAVITDPPYCSGAATESQRGRATHQGLRTGTMAAGRFKWFDSDNMTTAGLVWLLREVAVEAQRLLTPGGSLLMFCDPLMLDSLSPAIESAGFRKQRPVVWNKGHFGCGIGFRPQYEMLLHFTRRAPKFHAADVGNLITVPRVPTDDREHAAEKPVELLGGLLRVVCPRGGAVLDCFAGSMATGVAALQSDCKFVGIERDPSVYAAGLARLKAADGAGGLFDRNGHATADLFENEV